MRMACKQFHYVAPAPRHIGGWRIVTETDDYIAVRRTQDAFADIVTRAAWNELSELFADDATITVDTRTGRSIELAGPAELVTLTKRATDGLAFFQFVILNSRVLLYPN